MFENPRRGRQARNFTTNVSKILDLKSSSEQIFFRKLSLGAPALRKKERLYRKACRSGTDKSWARFKRHRRSVDRQANLLSLAGSEQHKALPELFKSLNRNVFGI